MHKKKREERGREVLTAQEGRLDIESRRSEVLALDTGILARKRVLRASNSCILGNTGHPV